MKSCITKVIFFDYGGVLADEGFRNGLYAIAELNRIDPERFYRQAGDLIHATGYLTGKSDESDFWDKLRNQTGISMNDSELKSMIMDRFVLRKWMMDLIDGLLKNQIRVAILSDQTNWLDELNQRDHFFSKFEKVFNSFYLGKSKRDKSLFYDVLKTMNVSPENALFVDDTAGHIERAASIGIHTILFKNKADFLEQITVFCPGIEIQG